MRCCNVSQHGRAICGVKQAPARPLLRSRPKSSSEDVQAEVLHDRRGPISFSVHGRHVQVDEKLRDKVIDRLLPVLDKMSTPEYVEAAGGGPSHVDVRLMNTSAEIHVNPSIVDRSSHALHDTFVRQGELKAVASAQGHADAWECFEAAVDQLEHKLKPQTKQPPRKVDYRSHHNH